MHNIMDKEVFTLVSYKPLKIYTILSASRHFEKEG